MRLRVVILTEIIAPYRIPVFNALAQREELDLHVVFLAETDAAMRQWRVYREEIRFSYEVLSSWRLRARRKNFLLNRGLRAALDNMSPEAVICGGYNYLASWEALWWARRRRARFILWSESNQHDQRSGRIWIESLKHYFVRHCDAFVVPGKSSFAYLQQLGAAAQNIFIAPNAVDSSFYSRAAADARQNEILHRQRLRLPERFILYAGRLVSEKGVFDLLEAYARLQSGLRAKVGLVFAGDGVARSKLVEQASRIDPGAVRLPGFAQREELAVLYALAEAMVLPTHSDPWGLVVNEAMVCGLPVIVSSVAGCAQDLVEDGWNGYAVPPHDPERLSAAIRMLLEQPESRRQMAAHSLERIRHFSPEECARGLAESVRSPGQEAR